jgi:hypothetical protein
MTNGISRRLPASRSIFYWIVPLDFSGTRAGQRQIKQKPRPPPNFAALADDLRFGRSRSIEYGIAVEHWRKTYL